MAANEIMANAALLETGHQLGEYDIVEPHDDLNMSQSTNDSYPTALKVAMVTNNDLVVAIAVLESQRLLANTMETFRIRCVDGITVNADTLAGYIERTVGIVTALNPVIGYEKATELAKEAYSTNKGILEIVREKNILSDAQIEEILSPAALTGLDKKQYQ